ncbi:heme lyase CcmF/NrfE family subunit [Vineibacter terrae]|uniref:Heme lyase CcmF/NrfE family subunit n=1 Tax=Vineibacter terrae TaxID=2586908 RepID=A0A5C8PNS1_9HYPH|nr:heme lyase CcmF/NrfE family subunit [Vineibacter terrae]TXL76001.1 heme lyase CcmF/NrfE family subunit [Vineibacter terrae]
MSPELGHYALVLALCVAVAQGTLPLLGARRGDPGMMELGRTAALAQVALIAVAFLALVQAYVTSDFSVANVVRNSHTAKPLLYKITGTWGNHEGSMLLWVLILAVFGAGVAAFGSNLPPSLRARVLGIQGLIGVGFLAFILFTSNPFERLDPAPLNGDDLNPLLQDPGLAFHPPLLYLGYVGFSITFSFAIAALIEGRVDAAWARWVRPWTLASWCFLTLGIALGSWWAYYELGWGGFWFWDPVENASFMPWLLGTALLHSAIVTEKRDALKSWTLLLAILAFSLSLLGTFLVRSGVLTSVHAFAQDPARGLYILGFLIVVVGGGLGLYAWRAPKLAGGGLFAPVSREGGLVFNNLLLATLTLTVFLGTLFPLVLDALDAGKVSVGPPFYVATFIPLSLPLLIAVPIGPFLAWKRGDLRMALRQLVAVGVVAVAAGIVTLFIAHRSVVLAACGIAVAVWLVLGALRELARRIQLFGVPPGDSLRRLVGLPRAAIGMTIAHAALGLTVLGITGVSVWQTETIVMLKPGASVAHAGYEVTLDSVQDVRGPNYVAERARLVYRRDGAVAAILQPERRLFAVQRRVTTEAAIRTSPLADLYATIGESDGKGSWTVRLYHNPLAPWIWLGAALAALGGFISLTDRRLRVGAPRRTRAAAPQPAE